MDEARHRGPQCNFCGLRPEKGGVAGSTMATFVCDDCIVLMVEIKREEYGPDWPVTDPPGEQAPPPAP